MARFWILVLVTAAGILAALGTLTEDQGPAPASLSVAVEPPDAAPQRSHEPTNRRASDRRAQRSAATAMVRDEERTLQLLQRAAQAADVKPAIDTQRPLASPIEQQRQASEIAAVADGPPVVAPVVTSVVTSVAALAEFAIVDGTSLRGESVPVPVTALGSPPPPMAMEQTPTIEPPHATHEQRPEMDVAAVTTVAMVGAALTPPATSVVGKAERRTVRPRIFARKPRPHRASRHTAVRRLVARRLEQQNLGRPHNEHSGG